MDTIALSLVLGACIGLVLALTGAGAGVLAIPLLTFFMHLPLQQAAPIALLAVGSAAAIGAILGLRRKILRYRAAALIGVAGMLSAPVGVALAQRVPNSPLQMVFASVLMYSAWRMWPRANKEYASTNEAPCRVASGDFRLTWTLPCARALAGTGLASGLMSGMLGVGGGFVIVPAMSKHTNLDIRSIQATSLAVIAMVSMSSIWAATWHGAMNWEAATPFAVGAVLALLVGRNLADRIQSKTLQAGFSILTAAVAALMLARASGISLV